MDEIIGKVDAVSQKWNGGIKIGENWYNGLDNTAEYVKKVTKGQEVEIKYDEKKKIHFLKVLSGGQQAPSTPTPTSTNKPNAPNHIPIDGEQKKVIVNGLTNSYGAVMESCKQTTEEIFSNPATKMAEYIGVAGVINTEENLELSNDKIVDIAIAMFKADFVSSRGQHCNSLFIAADRELRGRGISL
jgi:hypothetical protein